MHEAQRSADIANIKPWQRVGHAVWWISAALSILFVWFSRCWHNSDIGNIEIVKATVKATPSLGGTAHALRDASGRCQWSKWSDDEFHLASSLGGTYEGVEWIPRAYYQLPTSYCNEVSRADRAPQDWMRLCQSLRPIWRNGGKFAHFGINTLKTHWPPPNEYDKYRHLGPNAGDAVLTLAVRLVTQYFLGPGETGKSNPYDGRPRWAVFEVREESQERDVKYLNDPRNKIIGLVVGGGGLIYKRNIHSRQSISGWQWIVHLDHLQRMQPPIFAVGIGFNTFQNDANPGYKPSHLAAFKKSWHALASRSSVIGLRETQSIVGMAEEFPLPGALANSVAYQPCATTLVGAVQPCLATRVLLDRSVKRLSVNFASDRLDARLGSNRSAIEVVKQLVTWMYDAHQLGWTVDLIHQGKDDALLRAALIRRNISHLVNRIKFDSRQSVYSYYSRVTVAAAMRGHGVMVPFGVHVATITLQSHEKVRSFLQDIGHPEWGVELVKAKRQNGDLSTIAAELTQLLEFMVAHRDRIYKEIRAAQAKLMAITATNMLKYGHDVVKRAKNIDLTEENRPAAERP